jgi:hypothetical protein
MVWICFVSISVPVFIPRLFISTEETQFIFDEFWRKKVKKKVSNVNSKGNHCKGTKTTVL